MNNSLEAICKDPAGADVVNTCLKAMKKITAKTATGVQEIQTGYLPNTSQPPYHVQNLLRIFTECI
jgi:hypothetical protein